MSLPSLTRPLGAVALFALAALASATDGEALVSAGDRVRGSLDTVSVHRIEIPLVEGDRLRLDLRAGFQPDLQVRDPDGTLVDPGRRLRVRGDRARLRNLPLDATGRWTVEIRALDRAGDYTLDTRIRSRRRVRARVSAQPDETVTVPLGDLPGGALVTLSVRRGEMRLLRGPDGLTLPVEDRRDTVAIPSTGAWSVDVDASRGGRVIVKARIVPDESEPIEREVVEDPEAGEPLEAGEVEAGYVMVRLRDGADEDEFDGRHGSEVEDRVEGSGWIRVRVPEGVDLEDFLEDLGFDDDVMGGEPVLVSETPEGGQSNTAVTASETFRGDVQGQAGFALARASQAQQTSTGANTVIAILDTGIDATHPDLVGRLLPGIDLVDGDNDPTDEPNGIDDDGDGLIDEGVGHGTFIAGLVAELAPDAMILPIRVLDSDARGTSARVADGVLRAVARGADIINLSLGVRRNSALIQDAVSFARNQDVLVVASTGNAGATDRVDFPARLSDVLAVSAVDTIGVRPAFANVSNKVDVVAPGVDQLAAINGTGYARWSGTSFAAPYASAGAALVLAVNPTMRPRDAGGVLSDTAVAVDAQNPGLDGSLGDGRIDLEAAVTQEAGDDD